jgi:sugar lactone lactonase YvrE
LKIDRDGIITTVAGSGCTSYGCGGFSGDGGPATQAKLDKPKGVAVDSEGNIYIADTYNRRIRKVDTNGIITTIAGNGTQTYGGEGVPATQTGFKHPVAVAVDAVGNLYISDWSGHRIFKVDTNGIITTVAGDGIEGYSGDGGAATQARIAYAYDLAVDAEGNLFIATTNLIRKVDASGIITTVAGNGYDYSGDGVPATEAGIGNASGVDVDAAGNLYIASYGADRVFKVDTSGILITVGGDGVEGYSGDGGPAAQSRFRDPWGVAVDTAGNLYVADTLNYTVRKVSAPYVFFSSMEVGDIAFAEENGLGHVLSGSGQHKTTIDVDTGIVLREFGYDEENRLVSITDQFGNPATMKRIASFP